MKDTKKAASATSATSVKPPFANPAAQAKPTPPIAVKQAVAAPKAATPPPTPAPAAAPKPVVEPVAAAPAVETKPEPAPIAPAAIEGTKTMNDTITHATETAKNFAADAQAKSQAVFGDISERAKSTMEKSSKAFSDLSEFNKGNLEAIVESSKIAAKAAETVGQQVAETARKNFESATAAMKSFASVKTPTEFFQLQSEYARSAFDSLIADTSKNSEAMLKLVGEVVQPISNRFAVAAEKIKIAA